MTFKLSPHDKFPKSTRWTRTTAIEAFGVTYLHDSAEGAPIREVLGRREPHPWEGLHSVVTAFATDGEAIGYACTLAREEAEREIESIDGQMSKKGTRFRLALARNWKPAREREIGLLATESILDRRRRQCMEILDRGVRPEVRRLPEGLRMPIVLPLGIPVHVVDMRGFPEREVSLREATVVGREFVEAQDHPGYDILARYRIDGLEGTFSYDQDELVHKTFEGTPDGLRIFLLRAHALAHIHDFSSVVQDRLVQSLSPVIDLSPRRLPAPPAQASLSEIIPQAIVEIDEGREAEVIPFPAPDESRVEAVVATEVVEVAETEVIEAEVVDVVEANPPPAEVVVPLMETHDEVSIEVEAATREEGVALGCDAPALPSPAEVEDAFREPVVELDLGPALVPLAIELTAPPAEARDISAAIAAVEQALEAPVAPATVDDEFSALLSTAPVVVPELRASEAKPKRSMLARMSSIFSRRTPVGATERVEPQAGTVAEVQGEKIDRTFVDAALEFANSETPVELAPVPVRRERPIGEIESFLARGGIQVIRPSAQREADSLALGLIEAISPELLVDEDVTIAA